MEKIASKFKIPTVRVLALYEKHKFTVVPFVFSSRWSDIQIIQIRRLNGERPFTFHNRILANDFDMRTYPGQAGEAIPELVLKKTRTRE
jgi:hypothetical protein